MLQGESDVDRREMASWLCEAGEGHVLTKNRMHATLAIMGRCILEAIFQDSKFAFEKGGYICEQDRRLGSCLMGPVWGWGFCPGSRRPRARVPLVVWAWDLVIIRLHCCGPPAPARRQFFALRFATVCH